MNRTEGYFPGYDGKELYYQTWTREDAKLSIVLTHGFAEHSEPYHRLAEGLLDKAPVNIFAWDLRGHGKSYGKRGVVKDFHEYVKDFWEFYSLVKSTKPEKMILLGHSMGGLITIKSLIEYDSKLDVEAVVLSSPFLGMEIKVSPLKDYAAKLIAKLSPNLTLDNEIDYKDLTHDLAVVEEYEKDHLRHSRISPSLYLNFLETFPEVFAKLSQIQLPVFMQIAGDDRIVDKNASLKFYDGIGSIKKEKIIYDSMFHEVYNEKDREVVFKDLAKYLEKYID